MPVIAHGPKVTTLKPFRDLVVVLPASKEDKIGSIIIPDSVHKKNQIYGRIIAKGPEVPPDYVVGDIILFAQYAGVEVEMEDVEGMDDVLTVLVMPFKQIQAKITLEGKGGKPVKVKAPDYESEDISA